MHLPTDPKRRKQIPLATGVLNYFPEALCEVAELSRIGNEQHNPGQPLHWSKDKSNDHADCIVRHQLDAGTRDTDGVRHSAKVAWRALAQLQIEIDKEKEPAGWTAYSGDLSKAPLVGQVDVKLRCGAVLSHHRAESLRWTWAGADPNLTPGGDIISWRPAAPKP